LHNTIEEQHQELLILFDNSTPLNIDNTRHVRADETDPEGATNVTKMHHLSRRVMASRAAITASARMANASASANARCLHVMTKDNATRINRLPAAETKTNWAAASATFARLCSTTTGKTAPAEAEATTVEPDEVITDESVAAKEKEEAAAEHKKPLMTNDEKAMGQATKHEVRASIT
jgi:hypothetical protein